MLIQRVPVILPKCVAGNGTLTDDFKCYDPKKNPVKSLSSLLRVFGELP
jgi:hypothetical protein